MSDKKKEIPKNQRDMSSMQKKAQMQTLKQVMRYLGKYKIFLVFSMGFQLCLADYCEVGLLISIVDFPWNENDYSRKNI